MLCQMLVSFRTDTVFTQCSDCGVEPQMRGQTPPFAPQCTRKSPALIAGSDLPFVLLQSCRVQPRMQGLTPLFFVCVCKQKAGSAPAMYGIFPCVAREISYLSSFVLPHLRGLILELDHCIITGQLNPRKTDLTHLPGSTPESRHCVNVVIES